jgi:cell shape-determining protein MreD
VIDRLLALLTNRWTRLVLVALVVGGLQTTLFGDVRPFDTVVQFAFLYAALAGAIHGAEVGAIAGFVVGFLYDTALTSPFGLTAAVAALVGMGGGLLPFLVRDPTWWSLSLAAATATAGGVLALPLAMALVGAPSGIGGAVVGVATVAAGVNLLLSIPMIPVVRWTIRETRLSD